MAVPDRVEAATLLLSLDPPPWFVRHACAVAEVAGWLAAHAAARRQPVNRRLAETAALLHDVDKVLPQGSPPEAGHGERGAAWLAGKGHRELGPAVAAHPVTRLVDGAWFEGWLTSAAPEELIVAYADKRARQRLVSLDSRLATWRAQYPPHRDARDIALAGHGQWSAAELEAVVDRARRLEESAVRLAGVEPSDVGRLRWTSRALARARRVDVARSAVGR